MEPHGQSPCLRAEEGFSTQASSPRTIPAVLPERETFYTSGRFQRCTIGCLGVVAANPHQKSSSLKAVSATGTK